MDIVLLATLLEKSVTTLHGLLQQDSDSIRILSESPPLRTAGGGY